MKIGTANRKYVGNQDATITAATPKQYTYEANNFPARMEN
jgi:hypothetical protein